MSEMMTDSFYIKKVRKNAESASHYDLWEDVYGSGSPLSLFNASYYASQFSTIVFRDASEALLHYLRIGRFEGKSPNRLFDPDFYQSLSKVESGRDLFLHYLDEGWKSGLDPHRLFCVRHYLETNPDVAEAEVEPLWHYLSSGWKDFRSPHILFDIDYIRSQIEDPPHVELLSIYLERGWRLGVNPHPLFDSAYYSRVWMQGNVSLSEPLQHYLSVGAKSKACPHPLFDTRFYLSQVDIKQLNSSPLEHYLSVGWMDGLDPHPLFESKYYRENYINGAYNRVPELVYYIRNGWRRGDKPNRLFDPEFCRMQIPYGEEDVSDPLRLYMESEASGLQPHPLFDPAYYLERYPDVARERIGPLAHFLRIGRFENRSPHVLFDPDYYFKNANLQNRLGIVAIDDFLNSADANYTSPHPLFDASYYLEENPDVAESTINPLIHYLVYGWKEGRRPNWLFKPSYCLSQLQTQGELRAEPLTAYASGAWRHGIKPHPLFAPLYYLEIYDDVRDAGMEPLEHFLHYGDLERRNPSPLFDAVYYADNPNLVIEQDIGTLRHYLAHGGDQNIDPHRLFDTQYYLSQVGDVGELRPLEHYAMSDCLTAANPHMLVDNKRLVQEIKRLTRKQGLNALETYLSNSRCHLASPHLLFDGGWYVQQIGEAITKAPLLDYLTSGYKQGFSPHPFVEETWYHRQFLDNSPRPALEHYLRESHAWGFTLNVLFDEKYYSSQVTGLDGPGLVHYLVAGEKLGLRPNPYFAPHFFRASYYKQLDGNEPALFYYFRVGEKTGLRPSPEFDAAFYRSTYLLYEKEGRPLSHFLAEGKWRGNLPARVDAPPGTARGWAKWRSTRLSSFDIYRMATRSTRNEDERLEKPRLLWVLLGGGTQNARLITEIHTASRRLGDASPTIVNFEDYVSFVDVASTVDVSHTLVSFISDQIWATADDLFLLLDIASQRADNAIGICPLVVSADLHWCENFQSSNLGLDVCHELDIDVPNINRRIDKVFTAGPIVTFDAGSLLPFLHACEGRERFSIGTLVNKLKKANLHVSFAPGPVFCLPSECSMPAQTARQRRNNHTVKLLYVDSTIPRPDIDAGSDTAWRALKLFTEMGMDVTFLPSATAPGDSKYINGVRALGVNVIQPPYLRGIDEYLSITDEKFNFAFLSRAPVVFSFVDLIRKRWPKCEIIFNTVDLHYLREQREALLRDDIELFKKSVETKAIELDTIRKSDTTIVLSRAEVDILRQQGIDTDIVVIPPVYDASMPSSYKADLRSGVFFVGSYQHKPNVDAIEYFMAEVWPDVQSKNKDIKFHIVGSHMPPHFQKYASETVEVKGYVEDLDEFMASKRLMVSPLRYGAGVKVKVIASLSAGIPAVVTATSIEGTGLQEGDGYLIAEDAKEMASKILTLYNNFARLDELSARGKEAAESIFSMNAVARLYEKLFGVVPHTLSANSERILHGS